MAVIGACVFGLGGLAWAVPILFFFVTSSLLSRVKSPTKERAMRSFEKTGARDCRQVLANGGAATLSLALCVVTGWAGWYFAYVAAICEACADTWATEIGTLSRRTPVSLATFRAVEAGRSGGVTFMGTSAAVAGSLATALSASAAVIWATTVPVDLTLLLTLAAAGFLGSMADSILGGTVQAQYVKGDTGKITEKARTDSHDNPLIAGYRFIDNDAVNFLSTVVAAGSVAVLAGLLIRQW